MWLLLVLALSGAPQVPPAATTTDPQTGAPRPRSDGPPQTYVPLSMRSAPRPDASERSFDDLLDYPGRPLRPGEVRPTPVPGRAFTDTAWWERNQCGEAPTDACLRAARNRLTLARVERLEAQTSAPAPSARGASNCRTVTRPSETGFGGAFARVCGDADPGEAERVLERTMRERQARTEPSCDRPADGESQALWIDRCRALP